MERAGKLLAKIKLPPGTISPEAVAKAAWPAAVGPRIAARTEAVALIAGKLVVEVEDAVWQRQLFTLKGQILKRLEDVAGAGAPKDVEFRVRPLRRPVQAAPSLRSADEADSIADPQLRVLYRQQRRKRTA
ncbi:MAG: DUF721 domain-containing protein [Bryobacteraceae bacterium]|nr:DUF721 domain-containing protein [Bryobacteraceae bacterium]